MKRLAGGERCFVVGGGAIVGRVVGEPTTPSSWPTGSSTLFTTGQPSELSALYRGGASFSPILKMPTTITVLSKSYPTTQKQD